MKIKKDDVELVQLCLQHIAGHEATIRRSKRSIKCLEGIIRKIVNKYGNKTLTKGGSHVRDRQ
jgi:hypothetical protein